MATPKKYSNHKKPQPHTQKPEVFTDWKLPLEKAKEHTLRDPKKAAKILTEWLKKSNHKKSA